LRASYGKSAGGTCGAAAQGQLWLIDVSQSVDLDHPRALDFLREVRRLRVVRSLLAHSSLYLLS